MGENLTPMFSGAKFKPTTRRILAASVLERLVMQTTTIGNKAMSDAYCEQCQNPLSKGVHTCSDRAIGITEMIDRKNKMQNQHANLMGFNQAQTLCKFLALPQVERDRILRLFGA